MKPSILAVAVLILAGCGTAETDMRDYREYRQSDWTNRFVEYRRLCNDAGGFVVWRGDGSRVRGDVPRVGTRYDCVARSIISTGF